MLVSTRVIKVICLLLVSIVLSSQLAYAPLSAHELSNKMVASDNAMRCDIGHMMAIDAEDNCCDPVDINIENQCCFSSATTSYAIISLYSLHSSQPNTLSLIHRDSSPASFTIPDLLYRPPIV